LSILSSAFALTAFSALLTKMPVFSSAYFPSLAYLRAVFQSGEMELDLHEYFVKQSIRTRAEILSANGVIQLNVPIEHSESGKQTMREVKIDHSKHWQSEHWRAITSAYANAPYFEHYAHDLQGIFAMQPIYVHELNALILDWLNDALALDIKIKMSEAYTGQTSGQKKEWLGRAENATTAYQQVFGYKTAFVPNLSILDGLMNEGPLIRTRFLPR
jgi:hypothetical protein